MVLNECGQIAYHEWMKTPEIRPNVALGEFVVMPNHVHGIIRLFGWGESHSSHIPGSHSPPMPKINESHSSESNQSYSSEERGVFKTPLRSPSNNIGAIIRGYKSTVTKQLGLLGIVGKIWQRNYYEHIIRNEQENHRISEYIKNNPAKWRHDKFFLN